MVDWIGYLSIRKDLWMILIIKFVTLDFLKNREKVPLNSVGLQSKVKCHGLLVKGLNW